MDPATVERRLANVAKQAVKGDHVTAHDFEYVLWKDVLIAIANGTCQSPKNCAAMALRTTKLDFHRWPV